MEVKIIIIIISLIILTGIVLSAMNKKKIMKIVNTKEPCPTNLIKGFDKGGNQAPVAVEPIKENMENIRRSENREEVHPDPNSTKRSDICSTDACQSVDPYNQQLEIICNHECK